MAKKDAYVDRRAIMQVLGCVIKYPEILDRKDKYRFDTTDFYYTNHQIIYGAAHNLKIQGLKKISLVDIDNYLSTRPDTYKYFSENKGIDYIAKAIEIADYDKFEYYFWRMKKMTLLRDYVSNGVDIGFLYNPDTLDTKQKEKQEDWLDETDMIEIVNQIDEKINKIKVRNLSGASQNSVQAGEGLDQLLETLKATPEVGIPLYGSYINTITRGARLKKFYLRSAPSGVGKALVASTKVLTTKGYKEISKLTLNDRVYGEDGNPHNIIGIYPQGKKKVVEISFSNGDQVLCCEDHLWSFKERTNGSIITTDTKGMIKAFNRNKYIYMPNVEILNFPQKPLENWDLNKIGFALLKKDSEERSNKSDVKIPEALKLSSIKDRYELLKGIIGRDDLPQNTDHKKFNQISEFHFYHLSFAKDVKFLFESLGFRPHMRSQVVRGIKTYIISNKTAPVNLRVAKIRQLQRKEEMICIAVDNPSHLFLIEGCIPTHNTRAAVADACTFSCGEIYDLHTRQWTKHGAKEPTLYITTEQELDEIQTLAVCFISGVDEEQIVNGEYFGEEEERILKAKELIKKAPLWIEEMPNFSLEDIENNIRKHVIENKVKYVVLDYIHTSLKILEDLTKRAGMKLREDNVLYMLAIRLKDLCNELGIFLISSTQLNGNWEGQRDANQNLIRGAKAIADKIDFGSMLMPVTNDDIKCLQPLIEKGGFPNPNACYHIYKNRRGRHKSVKLWCVSDLGTCRIDPIFMTDNNYALIPLKDFQITVEED